jgi:hypothetical protein
MRALLRELAVIAAALLVCAGAIEVLRDRGALVPPPEMVVEEFVRELSLERWQPARTHLSGPLAQELEPDSLHALLDRLEERVGRIEDVRGRPFFSTDAMAEAVAEITTDSGDRVALRLPLVREHGLWKISRL